MKPNRALILILKLSTVAVVSCLAEGEVRLINVITLGKASQSKFREMLVAAKSLVEHRQFRRPKRRQLGLIIVVFLFPFNVVSIGYLASFTRSTSLTF